jgi:hypothetical protein
MRKLTRKGFARIYTATPDDVAKVTALIQELDDFEFDYLPKGLVAPFSQFPKLVYTGKFDGLDVDWLTAECWKRGICVWVCDNGAHECMNEKCQPILVD